MPVIIYAATIASEYIVLAAVGGMTLSGLARNVAWWDIKRREAKSEVKNTVG